MKRHSTNALSGESPGSTDKSPIALSTSDLVPLVYDELRALAHRRMANEAAGNTLTATALVHEAFIRLNKQGENPEWQNKSHFFRTAAEAMRRILIDRARAKKRKKRGGDHFRTEMFESQLSDTMQDDEIILVNEALECLEQIDPESAELIKLHFFVGLTWEEISDLMGDSTRTLRRKWTYAKSWLQLEIEKLR